MKTSRRQILAGGGMALVSARARGAGVPRAAAPSLWYTRPAGPWVEALPVGNGRLGAMVFGQVARERLQLNEQSLWAGRERDRTNPRALAALPEVRRLIFAGKDAEAAKLATDAMLGVPPTVESYQPLADLNVTFGGGHQGAGYRRELDLQSGIAVVSFRAGGARVRREVFSSAVHQVIGFRVTTSRARSISATIELRRDQGSDTRAQRAAEGAPAGTGELLLTGRTAADGLAFACRVWVTARNGSLRQDGQRLVADGADELTFLVAGATDHRTTTDPVVACAETLKRAARVPWATLRKEHVRDHRALFDRVSVNLGPGAAHLPTDERTRAVGAGAADPALCALQFQYCRYLLMAASRPGGLPSNLQGIWNEKMKAPWNSDYHPNINLQMNYWPAEVANLAECHRPLLDWVREIVRSGERTAQRHYGARGWVLHHVSDIFGCTTPMDGVWGVWPMGGAWIARHLWEHYLYGLDRTFLQSHAYPVMKGAAQFMLDFLVPAPSGTAFPGALVTNPSHSPENRFRRDGREVSLTYAATMDIHILDDLFRNCLAAIEALQAPAEAPFEAELRAALKRLPPSQVSRRTGRLQEWIEDYDEVEPGHRHLSHLFGVFPGTSISLRRTPALAEAARRSLAHRLGSRYDAQAWSLHWIGAILARLEDADGAHAAVVRALGKHTYPNMFVNAHGQPQVGDAHGFAAAVAEMLLQSHEDVVALLPALPAAWPDGNVTGLRARGGLLVSLWWKARTLARATLVAQRSGSCVVRTLAPIEVRAGGVIVPAQSDAEAATGRPTVLTRFTVENGRTYELRPTRPARP